MPRPLARLLLFVWTCILVGTMLTPAQELPQAALFTYDKLLHLGAFGLWSGLLWLALPPATPRVRWVMLAAVVLAVATEGAQGAFPRLNRSAELGDAAADLLGAGLAVGILALAQRRPLAT